MADNRRSDDGTLTFRSTSARAASTANRIRPSKIREARLAKRLTQTDLGARVDKTRQSISLYETGQTLPEPPVMERLASELEQPLSYFVDAPPPEFGESSTRFFRAFGPKTKRRNLACDVFGSWLVRTAKYLDDHVNYPLLDVPLEPVPASDDGSYTPEEIEQIAADCRRNGASD